MGAAAVYSRFADFEEAQNFSDGEFAAWNASLEELEGIALLPVINAAADARIL